VDLTADTLPENQISANYRLIENNKGSGKVVISKYSEQKLEQFFRWILP
jgi:hypothetical protein